MRPAPPPPPPRRHRDGAAPPRPAASGSPRGSVGPHARGPRARGAAPALRSISGGPGSRLRAASPRPRVVRAPLIESAAPRAARGCTGVKTPRGRGPGLAWPTCSPTHVGTPARPPHGSPRGPAWGRGPACGSAGLCDPGARPCEQPLPGVRGRCALAGGLGRNAKNALIVPRRAAGIRGSRLLGNRSVARSIAKGFTPRPHGSLGLLGFGGSWHRPARRDLKLEQKGPHGNRESSISTAFAKSCHVLGESCAAPPGLSPCACA
ncbi:translation initiation factor IF-2-like [Coturnix japonica]|uniref:translation initiation factor IF-2-like n=1 Tax=Coturnix japonica TaxID=93934 RepID=UPI000776E0DF|nr:translation initiation factor IF-2-like [Coturnix japonica]